MAGCFGYESILIIKHYFYLLCSWVTEECMAGLLINVGQNSEHARTSLVCK